MPEYVVAGNWKMNTTLREARALAASLRGELAGIEGVTNIVCPPFVSLPAVAEVLDGTAVRVGAQNVHHESSGAYTGEVSPPMLRGLCDYVIVGHSERRMMFGDTDDLVNRKVKAVLAARLRPILCVGESLEQREQGRAEAEVDRQVRAGLDGVASCRQLLVAYEPIWAIGTGVAATPYDAQSVMSHVRLVLADLFGAPAADDVSLLYGGSVSPSNAAGFFAAEAVSGALVGGASLQADAFAEISRQASRA